MHEINTFKTITLDLRPDVVKFWPVDDQYAVVGTYTLLEDKPSENLDSQQRVGSLNLVQVKGDELNVVQTIPTPFGVYDLHFAYGYADVFENKYPGVFAVATSTGSVAFYQLVLSEEDISGSSHPRIRHIHTIQYFSQDVLITSLAWQTGGHIAMTCSDGRVCLGKVSDLEEAPGHSVELMQHDFQAWTCSFVDHDRQSDRPNFGLVSGGDDATLRYTGIGEDQWSSLDLDINLSDPPAQHLPWVEKKIHGAGVTAVLPIGNTPNGFLLITGSYDDHIRLLHIPHIGRREVLAEANLDGGVFRIKIAEGRAHGTPDSDNSIKDDENEELTLIVSCMQAGARIVKLLHNTDDTWSFDVHAKFEKNAGTLLYASDCQQKPDAHGQRVLLSTSFEDRKLYLWKYSSAS